MSTLSAASLRDSTEADLAAITAIYAHHVRFGLATFEEEPPSCEEMAFRRAEVLARGLPWIVATDGANIVRGYAYAAPFRLRRSYRYTLEDSIYVAPEHRRRGIGAALLGGLVERCTAAGYRQMVAVVGDSANASSISLHTRLGFRRVGHLPAVGFKHDSWVDVVLMQRELGPGSRTPPAPMA